MSCTTTTRFDSSIRYRTRRWVPKRGPGVATQGYLATNSKGQTFVVVALLSDPAAVLPPSVQPGIAAMTQAAFELVRGDCTEVP
jgi:hypothetical protein